MSERFDIRQWMFRYRSYTPIPFLILMILFAAPSPLSLIVGGVLLVAGEAIRFWGVAIAGAETRTTGPVGGTFLITTGPFAFVRNPLYAGNMTMYAGIGVMSLALFPWLLGVAAVWFYAQYVLIVQKEEEYLRERFGSPYEEYCKHVRRFVPRLTPYHSATPPSKEFNMIAGFDSERRTLQAIMIVVALLMVRYLFFTTGAAG
jgi:protein-S-isoprenylcysteine O-methyltransferase Ste14